MRNDLISIIVPVYNVEKYIDRCIQSILKQTYTNWEVIFVNDGSTDKSGSICQNYAGKDKRMIYLEQKNQGLSMARNKALEFAKGKYICFVDSDDWVDSNYLYFLYEAIENLNSEIAICAYYRSYKNKNIPYYIPTNVKILQPIEFQSKILRDEIQNYVCNKIFRKELISNIRFISGIYYEDILFFNSILPKIKNSVPVINKPLYYYFCRTDSITQTKKLKNVEDRFNAFKSRYELNYISNEDKIYVLKELLISLYYFYQVKDLNLRAIHNYKNYIKNIPSNRIIKAKKMFNKKEILKYFISFYCPNIYRKIVGIPIYKWIKDTLCKTENK